jgi:signal transduction histidine kinase
LTNRCLLGMICDEDHMAVYEALHEVKRTGRPIDLECRLNPSRRDEIIVNITFVPIFLSGQLNGIHGIVKDITKRKQEERNLINSEKRYKELQQSINRFANDLADVMKVSDLEQRLLDEVNAVLPVARASIEELPRGHAPRNGSSRESWIQIGEKQHPVYLRIEREHPLTGMEKEWLDTAVHYVTILYDNLHLIEDLMNKLEELVSAKETPKWMLRLLFKLSEKERATLSSDLHDSVLQDLIIWYRKLESLRSTRNFEQETRQELVQIEEGLLDAIHQIRITCNELRPPFLLKMGLVESLKSLFEYTRMFANYEIAFSADDFHAQLNEEQTLGIYRIVQELLNNANKHARADKVTMTLAETPDGIIFTYSDNGVGMDLSAFSGTFQNMGLAGMEKRVLSLEGTIDIHSAPRQGFHVNIRFPKDESGGKQQWKSY